MGYITNILLSASLILVPVFNSSPVEIYQVPVEIPLKTAELSPKLPQVKRLPITPTKEQLALINSKAEQYNVSAEIMTKIISCESGFNENALGDYGQSRGLVQIHKPSHPTITDEQAYDAEFSVNFLAEKLSQGQGSLWTCYKMLSVDT